MGETASQIARAYAQGNFLSVTRHRWDIKSLQHAMNCSRFTNRACDFQNIEKQQYSTVHLYICSSVCFLLKSPSRCLFFSHWPLKLPSILWRAMVPHHRLTRHQTEAVRAHQLCRVLSSSVLCLGRYCVFLLPVFPGVLLRSILETWLSLAFVLGEKILWPQGKRSRKGSL